MILKIEIQKLTKCRKLIVILVLQTFEELQRNKIF